MLPMLLAAALAASAPDTATVAAPAGAPPGARIVPYGELKALDARMYGRARRASKATAQIEKAPRHHASPPSLRPKFALKDEVKFSK